VEPAQYDRPVVGKRGERKWYSGRSEADQAVGAGEDEACGRKNIRKNILRERRKRYGMANGNP
jgi:hypothetical protein